MGLNIHSCGFGHCNIFTRGLNLVKKKKNLFFTYCLWCAVLSHLCPTLGDSMDCSPPGSSVHGDYPGKNTRVGCHALLQGSSQPRDLTQVSCITGILYHLSHQGSPRKREWVTYPFSRGSSQAKNQNRVSCFARGFFTSWATSEALIIVYPLSLCHPHFLVLSLW